MARKTSSMPVGRSAPCGLAAPRWAKVDRIRLIHREVRERLSPGAIDLLFSHGELVVEGSEAVAALSGTDRVYATVMLTIELARCAEQIREPIDTATAERLGELMREHPAVPHKLTALARPHLARLAKLPAEQLEITVQTTMRSDAMQLLIDGDAVAWPRVTRSR